MSGEPRWQAFTDAEIEVLADAMGDAFVPEMTTGDPEYVGAGVLLHSQLDAERERRGFTEDLRPGSPYADDEEGGDDGP